MSKEARSVLTAFPLTRNISSRLNNQISLWVHDSGNLFEKYAERNQDLNLFLDSDTKSISILESYFKKRKRTDRGKWLINISLLKNVYQSTVEPRNRAQIHLVSQMGL